MKNTFEEIKMEILKIKEENKGLKKLITLLKSELLEMKDILTNKDNNI
jgi:hypothetical protein